MREIVKIYAKCVSDSSIMFRTVLQCFTKPLLSNFEEMNGKPRQLYAEVKTRVAYIKKKYTLGIYILAYSTTKRPLFCAP